MYSITLLMITKNASGLMEEAIESAQSVTDKIIIVDNDSSDNTQEIADKHNAVILTYSGKNLGEQRNLGLRNVKTNWVLVLDADERLSAGLQNEINKTIKSSTKFDGFSIPYQNHFLGKPIYYGGEDYSMVRLFKRDSIKISPDLVHEGFTLKKGKLGTLTHKINHYSYRTLWQTFTKFHDYALREAEQKYNNKESSSLKKIIMYPLHMFYARYIKDKGYKDVPERIFLDIGFAYMEYITYLVLGFRNLHSRGHL